MPTNERDIFSALFRWAHRQNENFTTDAFVFLINELQDRQPELALSFLRWLCFDNENCQLLSKNPSVTTWFREVDGIPDIQIAGRDVFVLVEVKVGSGLGDNQLGRYRNILAEKKQATKRLVLLTVYPQVFDVQERPHSHKTWDDVADKLGRNSLSDPVSHFLVDQFVRFLKRQNMSIDKVGQEYVPGVKALGNLMRMLSKSCEQAGLALKTSGGQVYQGFYTTDDKYWIGLYLKRPEVIRFQIHRAKADKSKLKALGWATLDDSNLGKSVDLQDAALEFFNLDKAGQMKSLNDFVRSAYLEAEQAVIQKT